MFLHWRFPMYGRVACTVFLSLPLMSIPAGAAGQDLLRAKPIRVQMIREKAGCRYIDFSIVQLRDGQIMKENG